MVSKCMFCMDFVWILAHFGTALETVNRSVVGREGE